MTDTSRSAPLAHDPKSTLTHSGTFDPADWLARYTALGGVYVANGKLNLCILVNDQTEQQLSQIRQMVVDLGEDDKSAILAFLHAGGTPRRLTWQDVVERAENAEAALQIHPFHDARPQDENYAEMDASCKAACAENRNAYLALLNFPAPDHAALSYKVKAVAEVYEVDDEATVPLLADVNRLASGASPTDDEILAAWEARRDAYANLNSLPNSDDHATTPEEASLWASIREAEEAIRSKAASSPAGVAAQLWSGLHTLTPDAWLEDACQSGNLASLIAREHELDWNARMIVAALRSLKSMEA